MYTEKEKSRVTDDSRRLMGDKIPNNNNYNNIMVGTISYGIFRLLLQETYCCPFKFSKCKKK